MSSDSDYSLDEPVLDVIDSEEDISENEESGSEIETWGKSKKDYYSGEDSDDAAEEVEEAKRIQHSRMEKLDEDDFQVSSEDATSLKADGRDTFQSPELGPLILQYKETLAEIKKAFSDVCDRDAFQKADENGFSLLSAKYQLLYNYCTNILFYLVLKSSGEKVQDHPVIEHLVKLRILLEKIRPMEGKLKSQIDRLLQGESVSDTLKFKPNPSCMKPAVEDVLNSEEEQVYKAPKTNPVYFDGEQKLSQSTDIQSKKRILKELQAEYSEAPEEERYMSKIDDRTEYEESNFMRFQLTKKELKSLKKQRRFVDDLQDLEVFSDIISSNSGSKLSKVSGKLGQSKKTISGDLEIREMKKKKTNANSLIESDEIISSESDTEGLTESKKVRKPRKEFQSYASLEDLDHSDKRPIGSQIMKNRGYATSTTKVRNPRIKQKNRFNKAQKKLKSQRSSAKNGPYTGQASIKSDITRSSKF